MERATVNQLNFFNKINKEDYRLKKFVEVKDVVPQKKFNSIELFAGAGGMALGMENAGFENLANVEIDKDACETLRNNRPDRTVIEDDIKIVAQKGMNNYINCEDEVDLIC